MQLLQHSRKVHGVELTPKKAGSGGKQKYADVDLDDEKIAYVPIDTFKEFEPIFEVTKCRERNATTGQLEDLEEPQILSHMPLITSTIPEQQSTQRYAIIAREELLKK